MATSLAPPVVKERLEGDDPVAVIDIRPKLDYAEGHIERSTRVPRRDLERRLTKLVPDTAIGIVLVDRAGERGRRDAAWLEFLGYESVDNLEGGMAQWREEGLAVIEATEGVPNTAFNVPSKRFGERVHVERNVPSLSPEEVEARWSEEDVLVVDVRTPEEYRNGAIPGAINLEGVNLARNLTAVRHGDQPVVVNCAGRTRSIIGTATLKRMGLEDVYELENGTMGWQLAGFELEHGADRHVIDPDLDNDDRAELTAFADELITEQGIDRLSVREFERAREADEVTYSIDVRSATEYRSGHIPGTQSIPGGQAIQTTDEHFAVHPAFIVFVSNTYLRAAVTAYWFAEMGFDDLAILDGGLEAWSAAGRSLESGAETYSPVGIELARELVDQIDPDSLADLMADGPVSVIDVDASWRFADQHVPGAQWVDRYDLEAAVKGAAPPIILTCRDGSVSELASAAHRWHDDRSLDVLAGGVDAWIASGRSTESGRPDAEIRDDYDKPWDQGEPAMRSYLDWELEMGETFVD